MKQLVILISGRGSNMQAIIEACKTGKLNAQVACVISNRPDAQGLRFAQSQGIKTHCINHQNYANRADFEAAMMQAIDPYAPDYLVLAGFMRILEPAFVNHYLGRLINIHPSLLPKYPGINTHQRAIEAGDKEHGASVHFVTPELDGGPVFAQVRISIQPTDTPESLAQRLIQAEHLLYLQSLAKLINKQVEWRDGTIYAQGTLLQAPLQITHN
jgi:phosphoribosylglycinamide formyltransferase-1